jgi:glycosyltransferase involved in cell wall biosynthesis
VLAGEGDEGAERRHLAAALGIGARVCFTGALPRAQVLALMRRARLFVLPSRREGLPYALLEAGIAGTPTVATAVGGVGEIVAADETGLLVPPEDPEALAAAIRRLLVDEGLRRRLAAALQARVRAEFSSTAMADSYLDLYAAATAGRRTA